MPERNGKKLADGQLPFKRCGDFVGEEPVERQVNRDLRNHRALTWW